MMVKGCYKCFQVFTIIIYSYKTGTSAFIQAECSVNRLLALHMHTHIIVLDTRENHVIVDVVMTRLYVIDPELYMVSEVGSTAPYQ